MLNRRFFFSALAGVTAGGGLLKDVVVHKVLRRPYQKVMPVAARPYMLYDTLFLRAECRAPLRVRVTHDGGPEAMVETTVTPRSGEAFCIMGVHQARAEWPIRVEVTSSQAFKLLSCEPRFMHPAFRRVDGVIEYVDPFYKPRPEEEIFGTDTSGIHRLAKGADLQYCGGPAAVTASVPGEVIRTKDGMRLAWHDRDWTAENRTDWHPKGDV